MYQYYHIQSDDFSKKVKRTLLIDFLKSIDELQQQNHQTFKNKNKYQWRKMILVETDNGNYTSSDTPNEWVTLIAIVCDENANQDEYMQTFKKIADFLGWNIYQE